MSTAATVPITPSICPVETCLRCLVCGRRDRCSCQPQPWNGKKGHLFNWTFKQHRRVFFTKEAALEAHQGHSWNPPLLKWLQSRIHPRFDCVDIQEITLCG